MSEQKKVIVVLDRDAAHYAAGHTLPDVSRIPELQRATMDAVQAAFSRDREALIEAAAEAIWAAHEPESNRKAFEEGSPITVDPADYTWNWVVSTVPEDAEAYRDEARAVLAAIERADQEEGDRG